MDQTTQRAKENQPVKHPNPRALIPLVLIAVFGGGGWYIDKQRARQRAALTGFFENQPAQVASRISGRVAKILVKEGDTVRAGQTLLELEAQPAQEETAAKLAAEEQAQQQLRETVNGPRPEEIRKQEAAVAEQTAALARLRNGALPEEIAQAQERVRQADALYRKARAGARPEEVAQARAAERAALARLQQSERGLTPEEKAQASARLDAARAAETLAQADTRRTEILYEQDAISRQQVDTARANLREATARRREVEEASRRAEAGSPAEELEQARQGYKQAQAALALVRAGNRSEDITAAQAGLAQTQEALKLVRRGARAEDVQGAEARLGGAQAALAELRSGSRKEQIAQARAAARAAAANAQSSRRSVAERIVKAPTDGIIDRIPVAVGDLVSAQTPVVRLTDPTNLWVRIYVPEARLAAVRIGMEAQLHLDNISKPLEGVVESIASQGEFTPANLQTPEERGKQVFGVRIRLRQPDPRIKPGMFVVVQRLGAWTP
jgi:multidrug resistance efflux pump